MDRNAFEAAAVADGYEVSESFKPAAPDNGQHTHDFDARLFILSGEATMTFADGPVTYRAGDVCDVTAGTRHSEAFGPDGCAYLVAKRS